MNIDINNLLNILDITPSSQNIMLVGKHGIGKSEILSQYYEKKGIRVVTLFLGQMSDPGDIIGLPRENGESTEFLLPYWFPKDNKPIVLFLDELNRARPEVLQTIMDLALNRKLAGHRLPEGSRIISAVNDGSEYQLTELDPALVSRFNIYFFTPSVREWLMWAQKHEIDKRVIDFISANPEFLDGEGLRSEDQGLKRTPDRRSWERLSQIIGTDNFEQNELQTIATGIIGEIAALKFCKFLSSSSLNASELLLGSVKAWGNKAEKMTTPQLSSLSESIYRFIEAGIETEKEAIASENLFQFYSFLIRQNKREVAALFVNLYSSSIYPEAMVFIVTKCPQLFTEINEFIKNI